MSKIDELKDMIVSQATLRSYDLYHSFIHTLKNIDPAGARMFEEEVPEEALFNEDDLFWVSEECQWMLWDLAIKLDEYAPEGYYFGSAEEDGSLFGFFKLSYYEEEE